MSQAPQASSPVAAAPVAPAPDPAGRHRLPPPQRMLTTRSSQLRTPELFRRWSIVATAACVLAAVVGSLAIGAHTRAADRIEANTGPVLVTTQTLLASLAEADAAATAAFLSGEDEDPTARRAHLDARARAVAQLEDASALIGDAPATHDALKDVGEALARYVGLVEAARATNLAGLDAVAEDYLVDAVEALANDLTRGTDRLSASATERLESDASALTSRGIFAMVALFVALAVVAWLHTRLSRRTRRLVNLPLAAAGLLLLVAGVWTVVSVGSAQSAFDDARDQAFAAIATTAEVQASSFGANDAETIALITGDTEQRRRADDLAALVATSADDEGGLLGELQAAAGDDAREAARVREARVRWGRYLAARDGLRVASQGRRLEAFRELSSAFNGFTFVTEGILADNRDEFFAGLEATTSRTRGLPVGVLALPLLAAVLALAGFQLRINEYR